MFNIKQARDLWHNCNRDPDMEALACEIALRISQGFPEWEVKMHPTSLHSLIKSEFQLDQLRKIGYTVVVSPDGKSVTLSGWAS